MMSFQDRRDPTKGGAATGDKPGNRALMTEQPQTICLESGEKSRSYLDYHERVLTALRGAWASDHSGYWVGVMQVLRVRLTVPERSAFLVQVAQRKSK